MSTQSLHLNRNQQEAVNAEGTVLIIAGPGTGKTQTLTARIRNLILEKKIPPSDILALTFTKKAATEMKERLKDLHKLPIISTFHGFAYDILSKSLSLTLITDDERQELLFSCLEKMRGKEPSKKEIQEAGLFISKLKENRKQEESRLLTLYSHEMSLQRYIDYDDLLLLLQTVLATENKKQFQYILVDEFQDTNPLQYKLIKDLSQGKNIFVIGDPYQSIYAFRGADPQIFERFQNDFPDHTLITLTTNYRSGQPIIDAAESLFLKKRSLQGVLDKGSITSVECVNEYSEAEWIVQTISDLVGGMDLLQSAEQQAQLTEPLHFSQIALIYRTHTLKRLIQKRLDDAGIPYQVVGDDSIFASKEGLFIRSVLTYLIKPTYASFLSLCRTKVFPLSRKTYRILEQETILSISERYIKQIANKYALPNKDMNTVLAINSFLETLLESSKNATLSEVIHTILTNNYMIGQKENSKTLEHLFLSLTQQFESVSECLSYIEYLSEHEYYDPRAERVSLMSMHASKGLEFDTVIICGFEEGIIPFFRKGTDREEEKRLLYVALTRAKRRLYLTHVNARRKKPQSISSFQTSFTKSIHHLVDPASYNLLKKQKKWKEKKSQMKLF